jgi:site-specific DNA recombinase
VARYILYARKSTESEDRQVLSIDSQIAELQQLAHDQQMSTVTIHRESRSAKAPGREVFGLVLAAIAKGEVDALLCWKLDRLARNPVDGGALIWALDEGKLKEIVTPGRTFTNTGSDKFWMSLEFGMAKKYVDDLSENVKRGIRAKLAMGWRPGTAPMGYLNDPTTKTIVPDPERFPLIRRVWDLVLAGRSPVEVLRVANEEWGFRTRKGRRIGNRPLARSGLYRLLSNPFFYGLLVVAGESYAGAHVPMVTKDEFDRVQELLGRPNRKHTKKYLFAYTGLIRCGECGAMVTAEEQVNRQGHRYIYYHCSKRLKGVMCSQKTVRAERLDEQIRGTLESLQMKDSLRDWALARVREVRASDQLKQETIARSAAETRHELERRMASLLDLRLRGLVSDDEYATKKQELNANTLRLREREREGVTMTPAWFEPLERTILFANQAPKRFATAPREEKREIVMALGSNLFLRDRILRIQLQSPFTLLVEKPRSFPPCGLVDGIRTFFEEHPKSIQWPSFCRA